MMSLTAWLWNQYSDDLAALAKEGVKQLWQRIHWEETAQRYREKVIDRYGYTRVLGQPKPIPLERIFTDLFILDRPTAQRRYEPKSLAESFAAREEPRWEGKRIHALQLITQPESQRLFILGKPGAGKTTLLRYVALQAAKGKLDKVPIMVTLRDWRVKEQPLLDFIAREFDICAFPDARPFVERLLKGGQAIVLFDGLDEVPMAEGQRLEVVRQLRDFADQYPSQCLITCRIAASDYVFERFTYVELADFTEAQMKAYAKQWFADDPQKGDLFIEELFGKKEHAGLREMGRNPILLTLLCLTFDETMGFPQRRVEIYEEALEALLKKWDASRRIRRDEVYRGLSLGRKRQMFARIAAEAFDEGKYVFLQEELAGLIAAFLRRLPGEQAADEETGEAVLRAIVAQHGIFIEQAHRLYTFAHLTFQEYFTARYITRNAASGTLHSLMAHIDDDRWREVFLLTAGMLDEAEPFFTAFQAALDRMVAGDEKLIALLRWTAKKAKAAGGAYKPAALRALSLVLHLSRNLDYKYAVALNLNLALDLDLAPDHVWDLDSAQAETLQRYIAGHELLLDCLAQASVENRAAIEARMLLPPTP